MKVHFVTLNNILAVIYLFSVNKNTGWKCKYRKRPIKRTAWGRLFKKRKLLRGLLIGPGRLWKNKIKSKFSQNCKITSKIDHKNPFCFVQVGVQFYLGGLMDLGAFSDLDTYKKFFYQNRVLTRTGLLSEPLTLNRSFTASLKQQKTLEWCSIDQLIFCFSTFNY